MKSALYAALAVSLATLAAHVQSADFDAESFHGTNCTRCHDSSVYTRPNRRVRSLQALDVQVARCDANLGIKLFPEDQAALVNFLNTRFYGFAK